MTYHRLLASSLVALFCIAVCCLTACVHRGEPPVTTVEVPSEQRFNQHWFQGLAEINRYELVQSRYGELHRGSAVLIFVTEPFLPGKQVKYEGRDINAAGALPILKLNATRKFQTGVYPYSTLLSVFTPVAFAQANLPLKSSLSVQEWCGHVYSQYNSRPDGWHFVQHSYFEDEADQGSMLDGTAGIWLEDGLWTQTRLDYRKLPIGKFRMIPSSLALRFKHQAPGAQDAEATLDRMRTKDLGMHFRYTLTYRALKRVLRLYIGAAFPFPILRWEEVEPATKDPASALLTTTAERTHMQMLAYWEHNKNVDRSLLNGLGLLQK